MSSPVRFAVFLSIVLGIWLLEHVYVGWRLASLPVFQAGAGRRLLWAVMIVGFLAYPAGRLIWHAWRPAWAPAVEWAGAAWMGAVFFLFAFLLVAEIVTLGGLAPRGWVAGARSVAALLALAATAWATVGGLRPPRVVEVAVDVPELGPGLDGFSLVQISDLHLGTLLGERFLSALRDRVERLDPDVVVITGDLFDSEAETVEKLLPELRALRARHGVYAVTGNHEQYAGVERCVRLMEAAGFEVLCNRGVEIVPGVFIAGVPDDRGARQTGHAGADLKAALKSVPEGAFVVLLQHAPQDELAAARAGVDLMLDGHTHGGQIWPFHLLVRRAYPHLAGVFQVGGMTQVVSRGAGRWGPPMRLAAPADIVHVTLHAGSAAGGLQAGGSQPDPD